jgi:hypothetical protein
MMRESFALSTLAFILLVTPTFAACPEPKELDVSLMLMNLNGPLISTQLADHIAWAFFQARYHDGGIFEPKEPAEIIDLGDRWGVTFLNSLYEPPVDLSKRLQVKEMGVEICKSNGAIVRIK